MNSFEIIKKACTMTQIEYQQIEYKKKEFNCPHCNVFSDQTWGVQTYYTLEETPNHSHDDWYNDVLDNSQCYKCKKRTYWLNGVMFHPDSITVEPVNPDMPPECKKLYHEAASVLSKSPRASAALLRLCVEQLMPHIGGTGKSINKEIERLVEEGIGEKVQQALDICRVIGNNAVHPGAIQIEDDTEISTTLFAMLNFIVEQKLSIPKRVEGSYAKLPENVRKAIEERDKKNKDSEE